MDSLLIQLINSLSKEERNGIRKQLGYNRKNGEEPVLLSLFNAMEKYPTATEDAIKKAVNQKRAISKKVNSIREHKTYLKREIFSYLKNNHAQDDFLKFNDDLQLISILANKGLAKEALKKINLFKAEIAETRHNYLLLQCNYYHAVALQQDGQHDYFDRVIDCYESAIPLTNSLNITAKISAFVAHSNKLQMGGIITSGTEALNEMQRLQDLYLGDLKEEALTGFQKRSYHFAKIGLLRLKGEFQEAQKHAEQAWLMTREYASAPPKQKLATLNDLLQCCLHSSDWNTLSRYLAEFDEYVEAHFTGDFIFEPTARHYRFSLLLHDGNIKKIAESVLLLEDYYLEKNDSMNVIFRRMLQLDLLKGFWMTKNYFKALSYVDLLANWDMHTSVYERLKETVLLFGLLIQMERWLEKRDLKTFEYLSAYISNFSRRLLTVEKQRENTAIHDKVDLELERFFIQLAKDLVKNNASRNNQTELLKKIQPKLIELLKKDDLYTLQIQTDVNLEKWLSDLIGTFKRTPATI